MEKLPCPLYCKRRGTQPSAPQKKGWQAGGERRSVAFYFALPEKQCLAGAPCGELRHAATASQCEWIHLLLKLLHKTLKNLQQLPERRVAKMKQMLARLEQVFMDGTERDIQRPGGAEEQRAHYSAQKKAHKVKNNVLVSEA